MRNFRNSTKCTQIWYGVLVLSRSLGLPDYVLAACPPCQVFYPHSWGLSVQHPHQLGLVMNSKITVELFEHLLLLWPLALLVIMGSVEFPWFFVPLNLGKTDNDYFSNVLYQVRHTRQNLVSLLSWFLLLYLSRMPHQTTKYKPFQKYIFAY